MAQAGDVRPIPDPTLLTTQQLAMAIAGLRETLEVRIAGVDKITEERFKAVDARFDERDVRAEQNERSNKDALAAALAAAKELVSEQNKSNTQTIAKSDAAFTKQIDQLGELLKANASGLSDKIDDVKDRLTLIEGRSQGFGATWGYIAGAVGTVVAIITTAMLIFGK